MTCFTAATTELLGVAAGLGVADGETVAVLVAPELLADGAVAVLCAAGLLADGAVAVLCAAGLLADGAVAVLVAGAEAVLCAAELFAPGVDVALCATAALDVGVLAAVVVVAAAFDVFVVDVETLHAASEAVISRITKTITGNLRIECDRLGRRRRRRSSVGWFVGCMS